MIHEDVELLENLHAALKERSLVLYPPSKSKPALKLPDSVEHYGLIDERVGAPQAPSVQQAEPIAGRDLRDALWLDPECSRAGTCQSLKFKALAAQTSERPAPAGQWQPIETADKHGEPVWLFDSALIDEDFNPTGTVDGHWQDDVGWVGAVWDGYRDEWATKQISPTHWMKRTKPGDLSASAGQAVEAEREACAKLIEEHDPTRDEWESGYQKVLAYLIRARSIGES